MDAKEAVKMTMTIMEELSNAHTIALARAMIGFGNEQHQKMGVTPLAMAMAMMASVSFLLNEAGYSPDAQEFLIRNIAKATGGVAADFMRQTAD